MALNPSPANLRLKKIRHFIHLAGFVLVIFSIFNMMSSSTNASGTILEAPDVLGQMTVESDTSETLSFDSGSINNGNAFLDEIGLSSPSGTAYDPSNNRFFISDGGNNRVLVFDLNDTGGEYYKADYVLGQAVFSTGTSGSGPTSLSGPKGLAYDYLTGRLFVVDGNNDRVLVYDVRPEGSGSISYCGIDTTGISNGMSASCAIGSSGLSSEAPSGIPAALGDPVDVAYDPTDNFLYVSQTSYNRVSIFEGSVAALTTNGMDAYHVLGQLDQTSTLAGWDDMVFGAGVPTARSLWHPSEIEVDVNQRRLYVADSEDGRVVVYDISGLPLVGSGGAGDSAFIAIGKPDLNSFNWLDPNDAGGPYTETPRQDSLINPYGLAVDEVNGLLYVSDRTYNRITVYDLFGQTFCGHVSGGAMDGMDASCVIGQGNSFTSITTGLSSTKMTTPESLSFIPGTNTLLAVDSGNHRVLAFDTTTLSNTLPATNNFGQVAISTSYDYVAPELLTAGGSNSSSPVVSDYGFSNPGGVSIDAEHDRMFVSDTMNHRILIFNLNADDTLIDNQADHVLGQANFTANASAATASGLNRPRGIAYWHSPGGTEYLFVADDLNNRILAYDVASITDGEDAIAVIGQSSFTNSGAGTSQNTLAEPKDVTVDSVHNRLFVADSKNNRVLVFDIATLTTTDMPAMAIVGQDIYTTTDTGTSAANVNEPNGVLYEPVTNTLYIADTRNNRVTTFDGSLIVDGSHGQSATKVLGQTGFGLNTSGLSQSRMADPTGFAYDAENNILFVTDSDSRVLEFDVAAIANGEAAIAVIGQQDFDTDTTGVSSSKLDLPTRMAFDDTNNLLYVADGNNNRVLIFSFISLDTSSIGSTGQVGTPYTQTLTASNNQGVVSFELATGTMPPGLSFDSSGIVGTPTVAGAYSFAVRAVDTIGTSGFRSNQQSYSITIDAAPVDPGGGCTSNCGGGDPIPLCTDPLASNYNGQSTCVYAPPTITVTSPVGTGLTTSTGIITVTGTASDNDTITSVSYILNGGASTPTTGTTSWSIPNVTLLPGSNTVTITARNNHNLQTSVNLTIIFSTIPPDEPTCETDPTMAGCTIVTPPSPAICSDGLDNDGDGKTDYPSDPGCSSANDNSEIDPPTLCQDPTAQNYGGALPCIPVDPVDPIDPTDPTDLCPNLAGVQSFVPFGYLAQGGICVEVIINPEVDPPIDPGDGGGSGVDTIADVISETVTNIFSMIGLVIGAIATILSMFGGGLAISEILLIPARLWQLLLGVLGFKKKVRHWGVVYDSVTKQPLDPAYVSIFDADGKEVATAITDLEGRYGFLVTPGFYRIEAHKTNYLFPSKKLAHQLRDQIYRELYFGDYFEIKAEGDVVAKNIPLDQENFDWNEYVKHERKLTKQHLFRNKLLNGISAVLFYIGFLSSVVALILDVRTFTIVIVSIYVLLFLLRQFVIKRPSFGAVSNGGEPVPYGVVKIYSAKLGTLLSTKVLDKYGRYYMLAPKGSYYAVVEEKKEDQSYEKVHQTDSFDATKGVINKKFKV